MLSFLAWFWCLTSVNASYQNCLEFIILCNSRWLKIEETAQQKSVSAVSGPRVWVRALHTLISDCVSSSQNNAVKDRHVVVETARLACWWHLVCVLGSQVADLFDQVSSATAFSVSRFCKRVSNPTLWRKYLQAAFCPRTLMFTTVQTRACFPKVHSFYRTCKMAEIVPEA